MHVRSKIIRLCLLLAIILVNVSCDQVTKSLVRKNISDYQRIEVIGKHLMLTKIENAGAFLSLGTTWPEPLRKIILSVLPIIALLFAIRYVVTKNTLNWLHLGLCFVIGGGIGNIFDRIWHGSVTDFLYVELGIIHTGIFNAADMSIMWGFGMILIGQLTESKLQTIKSTNNS